MNTDVTNTNKEISNNIGEQLKKANLESKAGSKLTKLKNKITEAKEVLKDISLEDNVENTREKMKLLLTKLYAGHNLEKQYSYLANKRTVLDMVTQAYNVVAAKQDAYEKARYTFDEELAGI